MLAGGSRVTQRCLASFTCPDWGKGGTARCRVSNITPLGHAQRRGAGDNNPTYPSRHVAVAGNDHRREEGSSMGVEKDVKTVYGTVHGQGMVVCTHCGATKAITIAHFPSGTPLAVACVCGQRFVIRIEVRQFVRRALHLPGQYEHRCDDLTQGSGTEPMVVENVSEQGLCFRTMRPHAVRLHETLSVHFTLDDATRTPVHQRAVVKYVDDAVVGVQFLDCETYNDTNRTIAMYLRSH